MFAVFGRVNWNSKEVSFLTWQIKHHFLKTTCRFKPKISLWTKFFKNLLLGTYFMCVDAALTILKLKDFQDFQDLILSLLKRFLALVFCNGSWLQRMHAFGLCKGGYFTGRNSLGIVNVEGMFSFFWNVKLFE